MVRLTRQTGVLLHPTSLPSRFGVGDLGPAADAFLDWASQAGLRLWQVLPTGPTGPHHSPYDGLSAFAGDPLLVSPEWLVEEGLLPADALDGAPDFPEGRVDWERIVPSAGHSPKIPFPTRAPSGGRSSEISHASRTPRRSPHGSRIGRSSPLFARGTRRGPGSSGIRLSRAARRPPSPRRGPISPRRSLSTPTCT